MQELWRKALALQPLPIRWHLVGHLQGNKVKRSLPLVHLIHSVDSLRLLQAIAADAREGARPRVLLQVNASHEEQKHGFNFDELLALPTQIEGLPVEVIGLMGMAALGDDPELARPTFAELRVFRDRLQSEWIRSAIQLAHLSMGNYDEAGAAFEAVLESTPDSSAAIPGGSHSATPP